MDYPSDLSSSDEDDLLLKMNWLRMENDMPPLNKEGVAVLDEEGQIRLTGDSFFRKISPEYTPDAEFYKTEFVVERKGWLEETDRKRAELVAAQIALEELRQHDRLLATKNDMLVEENNLLKAQNEELCSKLRRSEGILSRVKEELARFRAANGKNPCIHIEEEQRLNDKLKETEEKRQQLAQKLTVLCTSILEAAAEA